jgi:hypothetical protein
VITPGSVTETVLKEQRPDAYDAAPGPTWRAHLRALDHALGHCDVAGARRAWEHAHLAAYDSPGWEGLIAAGRASLRIAGGDVDGIPGASAARRAYFTALYRACRENSFEGILCAAEAFGELGDHEVVEECLGLAEFQLDGPRVRRRVAAFARRLGVTNTAHGAPEAVVAGVSPAR